MKKLLLTSFLLANLFCSYGQVIINEYSASNLHNFIDNYDRTEDWIELFNTSSEEIDISGFHLSDKGSKPGKWEIPTGTVISGNGFLIFWCSGRDEIVDGNYHTNFKLSQTSGKDKVVFTGPTEEILESYEMTVTMVEHSICRSIDGGSEWRICTNPTLNSSNNSSNQFFEYTVAPSMDLEAGFYSGQQIVSIQNNESNSILRYTTNGDNPTLSSEIYTEPISVTETTVIKALSFSEDVNILPGKMDFNTYFIDEEYSLAVFSVASDEVINLANGNGDLIPIGSIEYFNTDREREATSFGDLNRHGQDSWILDHRSIDWASRDEMGYSKGVLAPLFSYSERDDYQKFMFRNSGDDNYPANDDANHVGSTHIRDEYVQTLSREGGMHLDTRAVERVILFLNGKYWGVYGMRERPVDHDYTKEYYKQGKYDLHFLSTWGSTEAQYGGQAAFNDWYQLRDFILDNDMGSNSNYDIVDDQMDLLSLSDYFIANQAVVAKDWLNYNTGWWRGLREDKKHSKWGYLLWDMDATFDYYINYTGIPNEQADAKPCDIYAISESMDEFFGTEGGGNDTISNPEECETIISGSSPYEATDSIFNLVINSDEFCCTNDWDSTCQDIYDSFLNGTNTNTEDTCATILNGTCPYPMDDPFFQQVIGFFEPCCSEEWDSDCQAGYDYVSEQDNGNEVNGNVGKHEKILIKLLEESTTFQQLYYSRYTDLMNTVYSCENMNTTLERMLDVIRPEMPRQIERWGGTMAEWESNVDKLRTFINARCELLDDGMTECYEELTGPFNITLMSSPVNIGAIKLNTLKHKNLPWGGDYFGGMTNKIKASLSDDEEEAYKFSHWESKGGSVIGPDIMDREAIIEVSKSDTIIAVFKSITAVEELELTSQLVNIFPNPTTNSIFINYKLVKNSNVNIEIYNVLGDFIGDISNGFSKQAIGEHRINYNLLDKNLISGIYVIKLNINGEIINKKVSLVN